MNAISKVDEFLGITGETIPAKQFIGHTILEELITCPKKYSINVLSLASKSNEDKSISLVFGTALHEMIQTLWKTNSLPHAILRGLKFLDPQETSGDKNFYTALSLLFKYNTDIYLPLKEFRWEVAAIEQRGCILLPNDYRYYLSADLLLYNPFEEEYLLQELKTTTQWFHPARFTNSRQAIGYATYISALHNIQPFNINVEYVVMNPKSAEINRLPIAISREDCRNFFLDLLLEIRALDIYHAENYFPKRGLNCMKYNTPCPHFGVCDSKPPINFNIPVPVPTNINTLSWLTIAEHFKV